MVNNWIGQYTKEIPVGQMLREVEARRGKLITRYTKLAFFLQPGALANLRISPYTEQPDEEAFPGPMRR